VRVALAAVVLVSAAAHAQVYTYLDFKVVSTAQRPLPYYVDSRLPRPAGLDVAGVRSAADRAWATWNAVSCASPKVVGRGLTGGVVPQPPDPYDTFSVTPVWLSSQNDPDFTFIFGSGLEASISLPLTYAGVLETCDTYFNAALKEWSIAPVTPSSANDVETVMLHEAGHCLGLGHFGALRSVMYPYLDTGKNQHALDPSDLIGMCQRNPVSGAAGAPCDADGGCGGNAQLKCLAQPPTNGVQLTMCSTACTTGTNDVCDLPLSCQTSSAFAGFNGACLLPGTSVTPVGKICMNSTECTSSVGVCNRPMQSPTGNTFWVDGYCTQGCAAGQPGCPPGSECFDFGSQQTCLQTCRVGLADCRPDYSCVATRTEAAGVCLPRCYGDADCADSAHFACRTCDGLCVSRNNPVGQLGTACSDDSTCGLGQTCRAVDSGGVKICTLQCARGCGTCPTGASCTPLASGDLFCLKNCAGPGTCPSGLRCAATLGGQGCVPACTLDSQCPVGQTCASGECVSSTDAGCPLCTKPDSGVPITPPPKDGGTGGGGTGGCGCSTVDAMAWLFALAVLTRRRSSWQER
jgi:Matrixin